MAATDQARATFSPDARSVGAARSFIRRILLSWGAAAVVDDAVLLVSEFVTNAVVHAGTQMDVTCTRYADGIRVDVLDRYPARGLPAAILEVDAQREGGRGLFLSSALASAWGVEYTRTAKRVWFRLDSPGGPRPGDPAVAPLTVAGTAAIAEQTAAGVGPDPALELGPEAVTAAGPAAGPALGTGLGPTLVPDLDRGGGPVTAAGMGTAAAIASAGLRLAAVLVDVDGLIRQWSADAAALFGWSPEDVYGAPLAGLVAWPHQPGPSVPFAESLCRSCWQGEYAVRHADGRLVEVFALHRGVSSAEAQGADKPGTACLLVLAGDRALLEIPATVSEEAQAATSEPDSAGEWAGLADPASVRLGLDELLRRIVERVRDRMGGDAALVMLATDDEAELEVRSTTGLPPATQRFARLPIEGMASRLVSHHLPAVYPDLGTNATAAPHLRGTGMRALLTVPLTVEGRLTGTLAVAAERPGQFGNSDVLRLQAAADRIALPVESARLAEMYRVRRGWLSFLAEASDLLAGTLDPQQTLAIVAQLVVPRLASWCAVHIAAPGRPPRLSYVWHQDETCLDPLRALLRAVPAPGLRAVPGARSWTALAEARKAGPMTEEAAQLATDVVINLPLVARGHSLGMLSLGRPSGDRFRRDVLDLAEDLSRRAALALDNARLYSERAATSHALQSSLLPPGLPDVPGLDVGVVYQAAGEGNEVGGDFYDLFTIDDDRWGFAIGDVCGTGAEAAAVTGLARNALRILARAGYPVPAVLERLNGAILGEGPRSRFLTLLYGEITHRAAGGLRLTLASAGHPLPVLLRASGEESRVGTPQPLLGVLDTVELSTDTVELNPEDVLVCVTDGVTERRNGDAMLEDDGLARVVAGCGGLNAGAVATRIHRAVLAFADEPPRDDMAILVLRAL